MPAPGDQYHGGDVTNPFEERVVNGFTAREIATLQSRLNKQLGPEYISQRPGNGGGKVAYLEGNKAIALANEVFGFNGWSSSLGQVQIDYVDELQCGKVSLGLSIVVRITLKDGTYHEDIGYGSIENGKGKAASFEKAKKEAATDGLKRALRTFGNVLGNCLYDKQYLKKVQAMKVKPVEFQEDNLHRHADFAPPQPPGDHVIVKREPQRTPHRPNQVLRTRTDHLNESFGADFDDEADENLFDGVDGTENGGDDFTSDSLSAPDTTGSRAIEAPRSNGVPSARTSPVRNTGPRQPNPRLQPGTAGRGQNGVQPQQPAQTNGRPPQNGPTHRQPQTPVQAQNQARPVQQGVRNPPQKNDGGPIQRPPVQNQQGNQQNGQAQPLRPTPPQAQQAPNQVRTPAPAQSVNTAPLMNSLPPPKNPPVGFVTSRAAEDLQKAGTSFNGLPAFNPNVESPIPVEKRTPGVNHGRSVPITREAIGAPAAPVPAPQAAARPGPPATGGSFNRPSIVNPHLDANRRIGMPGAPNYAMSPSANRGAYKPPTFANGGGPPNTLKRERPALQDVSNVNTNGAADEGPDMKKQKVDAPGTENAGIVNT